LSAVAHIGNCIAHLIEGAPGWEAAASSVDANVAEAFNLTPARLEAIVAEVRDSCDQVDHLMSMA
jgi:hypothetical protein